MRQYYDSRLRKFIQDKSKNNNTARLDFKDTDYDKKQTESKENQDTFRQAKSNEQDCKIKCV
jgi:hypothetical protein